MKFSHNILKTNLLLIFIFHSPVNAEAKQWQGSTLYQQGRQTLDLNGEWYFRTESPSDQFQLYPSNTKKTTQRDTTGLDEASKQALLALDDNDSSQSVDPKRESLGTLKGFHQAHHTENDWQTITVPSAWDSHDAYSYYRGNGWYRKHFTLTPDPTQNIRLRFEGVYYQAEVWLNGHRLGHYVGGYMPFEFDINPLLAKDGNNIIAVRVNNQFKQGAWWPWGGLIRPVSVIVEPHTRVAHQRIVADPNLNTGTANLTTEITLSHHGAAKEISLTAQLRDQYGTVIQAMGKPKSLSLTEGQTTVQLATELAQDSYQLWHFDTPHLYYIEVTLTDDNRTFYQRADRFGIRKIELSNGIFTLNGEAVRLIGYNRISDDKVNGSTEPTYVVRRDLDRMKAAGNQLTRIHHVQQAKAVLDYADEIGMLLIGEVPLFGDPADISEGNQQTPFDLKELIRRDVNHPSLFAWCVANEIPASGAEGNAFLKRMTTLAKTLDPSRPVTFSRKSASGLAATDGSQYMDFPSVNLYGNFRGATAKFRQLWPNKPVMVTEFSSDGYLFTPERESREFDTKSVAPLQSWHTQPWMFAASLWSFNDYRSLYWASSHNHTRGWGIQDSWGQTKQAFHTAQAGYSGVATLALEQHGNKRLAVVKARKSATEEIPSYTLYGYRLVHELRDTENNIVDGNIYPLPTLAAGSKAHRITLKPLRQQHAVTERLAVINATGHVVKVLHKALTVPQKPKVIGLVTANSALRIQFDPQALASEYSLTVARLDGKPFQQPEQHNWHSLNKLQQKGVIDAKQRQHIQSQKLFIYQQTTAATFSAKHSTTITAKHLPHSTPLLIRLVAKNDKGESEAYQHTLSLNPQQLPMAPEIQALIPLKKGFALGFIKQGEGFIQTGAAADPDMEQGVTRTWQIDIADANNYKTITRYTTDTVGATKFQQLDANSDVAVRIRRHDQASVWSEWHKTRTRDGKTLAKVITQGVISTCNSAAIAITAPIKAERYHLELKAKKGIHEHRTIERAAVEYLMIDKLVPDHQYQATLSADSADGISAKYTFQFKTRETCL